MEKIKWDTLSNSEIQLKQLVLKERYENVKNVITTLLDELDLLDKEFVISEQTLDKRLGKKR